MDQEVGQLGSDSRTLLEFKPASPDGLMPDWSTRPDLIPRSLQRFKLVSQDGSTITYGVESCNDAKVMQSFSDAGRPLKMPRGAKIGGGSYAISNLGPKPPTVIPEWVGSSFPPAKSTQRLCCARRDLHPKDTTTKDTHIQRDVCCTFMCTKRELSRGDLTLYSFQNGNHVHQCSLDNLHLLPITPPEKDFLLGLFVRYESTDEIWDKVFQPAIEARAASNLPPNRLLTMTVPVLNKYAKLWGVDKRIPQGDRDFQLVRSLLQEFQEEGATIAYKIPGFAVDSANTILAEEAKRFLKTEDLFIGVVTKLGAQLLREFGDCVSADGTHMVFTYTNIKVIVVLVGSCPSARHPGVQDRGFPVAMVLTTSEREDVHKALVAHLLAAVGSDWKPKVLMTDMAFSAYNAWKSFFPDLKWLWCRFHVLQAWLKRLKRMPAPPRLSADLWERYRGWLVREILDLISPDDPSMSREEFEQRCHAVSQVLWCLEATDTAALFDQYIKNADLWSPHARRLAAASVGFTDPAKLPKLIASNNALERFFGVLKHTVLKGKPVKTVTEFLQLWRKYQVRIYLNALHAKVLHAISFSESSAAALAEDEGNPFVVDALHGSDDGSEDEDIKDDGDEPTAEDLDGQEEDFKQSKERDLFTRASAQHKGLTRVLAELSDLCAQLAPSEASTSDQVAQLSRLYGQAEALKNVAVAAVRGEAYDGLNLSFLTKRSEFIKQRDNYDSSQFVPSCLSPLVTANVMVPTSDGTATALAATAPSLPSNEGDEKLSTSVLRKAKRAKRTKQDAAEMRHLNSFAEVVSEVVTQETLPRALAAKSSANNASLPLLRNSLGWNTGNRIRAVAHDLFKLEFPKTALKTAIIAKFVSRLLEALPCDTGAEVLSAVADLGVVHTPQGGVVRGELILLRANSLSNAGEECVAACENLSGWAVREGRLEFIDIVPSGSLFWGRLFEKRRECTIFA